MTLTVEILQPADEPAWTAFVDGHPEANCYHLLAWRHAAQSAYAMRAPYLLARRAGAPCGVLPLFVVKRAPLRRYLTTGLFGAYGPVLADAQDSRDALLEAARALAREEGAQYLVHKALGDHPEAGADLVPRWVIATLPLDPDPGVIWNRVRGRIRTGVRQAHRMGGWELREGPGELAAFYDVLAENMHRKGAPIYGARFMRDLVAALGPHARVVTLWREGAATSGALVITYRGVMSAPFVSSRASAFHLRPNNLLYWELLAGACRAGIHTFDFGRSQRDSTTLEFKLGFRPEVVPQPFVVWPVHGPAPAFDADTPAIRALSGMLKRLPRFVADAVGPEVCRRFLA